MWNANLDKIIIKSENENTLQPLNWLPEHYSELLLDTVQLYKDRLLQMMQMLQIFQPKSKQL